MSVFKENYPALEKYSFNEFFWLVIITTTVFYYLTKVRKIESYGASKVGTVFLYILVATRNTYESVPY
jgi:hypothetical protein